MNNENQQISSQEEQTDIYAEKPNIDLLLTTGELAKSIHDGAVAAGHKNAIHFDTKAELIAALPRLISTGDFVLVKASKSQKFDEIVEALRSL